MEIKKVPMVSFAIVSLLVTTLIGCNQDQLGSELDITNGIMVSEKKMPQVAFLISEQGDMESICTGTFVNDHQVVTAGHCVEDLDQFNPLMYVVDQYNSNGQRQRIRRAQAVGYSRNPRYSDSENNGVNGHDLAIVNFPENTSANFARISPLAPKVREAILIAGYGNNRTFLDQNDNQQGTGAGTFRIGRNFITEVSNGMLYFEGIPARTSGIAAGEHATSASGDSGGPLFDSKGQLAGVTSGGGLEETATGSMKSVSSYVNLNSSESRKFLTANLDY